jgi:hypothetical protein
MISIIRFLLAQRAFRTAAGVSFMGGQCPEWDRYEAAWERLPNWYRTRQERKAAKSNLARRMTEQHTWIR